MLTFLHLLFPIRQNEDSWKPQMTVEKRTSLRFEVVHLCILLASEAGLSSF